MRWRAAPFVEAPVRAFNSIDTVFHDVRPVRDAWSDLFSAYLDARLSSQEGGRIRQDKLNSLLHEMAKHLGYERTFTKSDFERVYNPDALSSHYSILLEQQRQTYASLFTPPTAEQNRAAEGKALASCIEPIGRDHLCFVGALFKNFEQSKVFAEFGRNTGVATLKDQLSTRSACYAILLVMLF